ncbi:unnamed protein product, partial [Tetraodon nigroviridis]
REDSHPMDGSRSHPVQIVHLSQQTCRSYGIVHVGSHVLRREAVLGHDQPRCTYYTVFVKRLLTFWKSLSLVSEC